MAANHRPRLITMGLDGLAKHEPVVGECLISIGSKGEPLPEEWVCYVDVLRVEFDDDQWDGWEARGRNLSHHDAKRIIRFVDKNIGAPRIAIHCTAGASRSVSVAQALATLYKIPHRRALILNYGAYWRTVTAYSIVKREGPLRSPSPDTRDNDS
jgi:predicted protein tyrosine phosphatase